ncbi:TerB family tellurite resistance protein [Gammaproteobacteria bacterium]|nr:TerB family tellurite resistance protein [Gammaproteobacteria bacterium]
MFKTLFSKKDSIDQLALPEVDVALQLMFEVAMSDGHLDKTELALLRKRVREIAPLETAVSNVIKAMIDQSMESVSLYPTIKKINDTYNKEEKKDLLQKLWQLVAADNLIDPYEESLYFQIADLMYVERAKANQIKHENS